MSWRTLLATFRRRTQTWPMPVRVAVGVIATGLSVGVAATLVTELLHLIQHLAYGYTDETFLLGVEHADPLRRVLAPTLGLGLAGLAWMWLRRRRLPQVSEACGPKARRLPLGRTTADALLQILAVGTGASIGRSELPARSVQPSPRCSAAFSASDETLGAGWSSPAREPVWPWCTTFR